LPCPRQRRPIRRFPNRCERGCACREVNGSPVIGVDQRQIPELCALIEIGNTWHRRFQEQLGEAVKRPNQRCAPRKCVEAVDEARGSLSIEKALDKVREARLITFIGASQLVCCLPSRAALTV